MNNAPAEPAGGEYISDTFLASRHQSRCEFLRRQRGLLAGLAQRLHRLELAHGQHVDQLTKLGLTMSFVAEHYVTRDLGAVRRDVSLGLRTTALIVLPA